MEEYQSKILHVVSQCIPPGSRVALFDFPNYANVGDSAIWLGTIALLKSELKCRIVHVDDWGVLGRGFPTLTDSTIVAINGGGNFGDLWLESQTLRERLVIQYPNNRIVQFPQSIFYRDRSNFERTHQIFRNHNDIHIMVRDQESLIQAQQVHDGYSGLCPDMALYLGKLNRGTNPQVPILGLLRNDQERAASDIPVTELRIRVTDWAEETETRTMRFMRNHPGLHVRTSSFYKMLKYRLFNRMAMSRLSRGCRILSLGKVVITDRLHGHILSTLLGIPHVTLDNSYGKISSFRKTWNTGEESCHHMKTMEEAINKASKLLDDNKHQSMMPKKKWLFSGSPKGLNL